MNMFKKNGGFTLVELIVVIAILAILAGVAVPAYSGYIAKANEAADLTQLDAIKTAAAFAYMDAKVAAGEGDEATITALVVTEGTDGAVSVKVNTETADTDISDYYNNFPGFKSEKFEDGAKWSVADGWEANGE